VGHRPEVIEARLAAFERDPGLYAKGNFSARAVALDVIQQVYQLLALHGHDAGWGRYTRALTQQARVLEARLREADADFFQSLRRHISRGNYAPNTLRHLFDRYTRYRPGRLGQMHRGYDTLDALVQGIISTEPAPDVVQPRHTDMIAYEPTPARVVLDLVDQTQLTVNDGFYDLGAGLGHVAILVHLMTGARVTGVEIESAYCLHAQGCAAALGLSEVRFLNLDARDATYADGTVFFMFTPFTGKLLEAVLVTLAREASRRPLLICTYGACTFEVAGQPWLRLRAPEAKQLYTLAVFESV
jgi:hypothetical protein